MPDESKKRFDLAKETVIANFEQLLIRIDDCEEMGMVDREASFYNHTLDIKDLAESADNYEELKEAIVIGKEIETNIDVFLSQKGFTTKSLSWPEEANLES